MPEFEQAHLDTDILYGVSLSIPVKFLAACIESIHAMFDGRLPISKAHGFYTFRQIGIHIPAGGGIVDPRDLAAIVGKPRKMR